MENHDLTFSQFTKKYHGKWPSRDALRWIYRESIKGKNTFQDAFKKVGGRVYVNDMKFWEISKENQKGDVNSISETYIRPEKKTSRKERTGWTTISMSIPNSFLKALDEMKEKRIVMTRNGLILEAIQEKIKL